MANHLVLQRLESIEKDLRGALAKLEGLDLPQVWDKIQTALNSIEKHQRLVRGSK